MNEVTKGYEECLDKIRVGEIIFLLKREHTSYSCTHKKDESVGLVDDVVSSLRVSSHFSPSISLSSYRILIILKCGCPSIINWRPFVSVYPLTYLLLPLLLLIRSQWRLSVFPSVYVHSFPIAASSIELWRVETLSAVFDSTFESIYSGSIQVSTFLVAELIGSPTLSMTSAEVSHSEKSRTLFRSISDVSLILWESFR